MIVPDVLIAFAELKFIVPADNVVPPVYELFPDNVNAPAPALVRVVPVPDITPE